LLSGQKTTTFQNILAVWNGIELKNLMSRQLFFHKNDKNKIGIYKDFSDFGLNNSIIEIFFEEVSGWQEMLFMYCLQQSKYRQSHCRRGYFSHQQDTFEIAILLEPNM
jgi:hypothetical protein